jgi:hypothetical protein
MADDTPSLPSSAHGAKLSRESAAVGTIFNAWGPAFEKREADSPRSPRPEALRIVGPPFLGRPMLCDGANSGLNCIFAACIVDRSDGASANAPGIPGQGA